VSCKALECKEKRVDQMHWFYPLAALVPCLDGPSHQSAEDPQLMTNLRRRKKDLKMRQ